MRHHHDPAEGRREHQQRDTGEHDGRHANASGSGAASRAVAGENERIDDDHDDLFCFHSSTQRDRNSTRRWRRRHPVSTRRDPGRVNNGGGAAAAVAIRIDISDSTVDISDD